MRTNFTNFAGKYKGALQTKPDFGILIVGRRRKPTAICKPRRFEDGAVPVSLPFESQQERKMQRLFLVRHGETDYNKTKIIQGGGVDSDINATGRRQGQLFFRRYGTHPFTGYYVTGLRRTAQTMAPFMENGVVFTREPRLNEMNWGILEGVDPTPRQLEMFVDANRRWENGDFDYAIEGAETPHAVQARALAAVWDILHRHPRGDVLVCTHGRVLRILLTSLTGAGLEKMNDYPHQNAGLNVLARRGALFVPERLNDVEHLNETEP